MKIILKKFSSIFRKIVFAKDKTQNYEPKRRKVDNDSIRARIMAQGWKLLEIPIKRKDPKTGNTLVARWKIVATKGQKSLEVGGIDINEALRNIGLTLGVISKDTPTN
jgi:hypothetical protein